MIKEIKIVRSITNRDSVALQDYYRDVNAIEMITLDEEIELARRIKMGDEEARNRLIEANLRFVISVAKQYQNMGVPLADLINEGNIGLAKAADKFDETRGFKFISFAVWWVRQSILQALADSGRTIRLPQNQVGLINKIKNAVNEFEQKNERMPSVAEISELIDVPVDKITLIMGSSDRCKSLDEPFSDDESGSLIDVIATPDAASADADAMKDSLMTDLQNALLLLSERDRNVISRFYGIGTSEMSLEEIALDMGLTRERVRQIRDQALRRLRGSSVSSTLRNYLTA